MTRAAAKRTPAVSTAETAPAQPVAPADVTAAEPDGRAAAASPTTTTKLPPAVTPSPATPNETEKDLQSPEAPALPPPFATAEAASGTPTNIPVAALVVTPPKGSLAGLKEKAMADAAEILNDDTALLTLLESYGLLATPDLLMSAVLGMKAESWEEIWMRYHQPVTTSTTMDLTPPLNTSSNSAVYAEPSLDWKCGARATMVVLKELAQVCDHMGCPPQRWRWEYVLMRELDLLPTDKMPSPCFQTRCFAMLVCLILSAASTDSSCLESTVQLKKAGLLTPEAMAKAGHKKIMECITKGGIQKERAKQLSIMSRAVCDNEKGKGLVPTSYLELRELNGVGPKTATIMCNEGFGFFQGIAVDLHVRNVALAVGLFELPARLKTFNEEYLENSLRTWVDPFHYRGFNRICGTVGQLLTQDLASLNTAEQTLVASRVVHGMHQHFRNPFHVELLWFCMKSIRQHYSEQKVSSNKGSEQKVSSNKGDEE